LDEASVDDGGVANRDAPLGLRSVGRTDIDPKIARFDAFLVVPSDQMRGFAANYAKDIAIAAYDPDPLPDDHGIIPATDGVEPEEPLFVDVRDEKSDLVDVSLDDDLRRTVILQPRERIAKHITPDIVRE